MLSSPLLPKWASLARTPSPTALARFTCIVAPASTTFAMRFDKNSRTTPWGPSQRPSGTILGYKMHRSPLHVKRADINLSSAFEATFTASQ